MGRWKRAGVGAFGAVLAAVCAPGVGVAQQDGAALPVVELPADLDRVLRDYEVAWRDRDADALAALFTPDGFVLRPGEPPVRGRDAIREAYAESGGSLVLRAFDYGTDGPLGFIIGGYAREAHLPDAGKFILALRRGPTGAWLIAADMDNGN